MRILKIYGSLLLLLAGLNACSLEKEVELNLPDYQRQLVVECFLEPGEPFRVLLFESIGFTDPIDTNNLPFVDNALVVIAHNGVSDTIPNLFAVDIDDFKIYNYSSPTLTVPFDYTTEYSLYIRDSLGREVTGTTRILPPPVIRELKANFQADSAASVDVSWLNRLGQPDFHYYTLHRDNLIEDGVDSTRDGLRLAFTLDDRIGDGEDFRIGTFANWEKGEDAIVTLYSIDEPYWRYLQTVDEAESSNGNPFAQPGRILSTVEGGLGVFTGLSYIRDTLAIE
ncbi:MAG: DUF4249 domain-containing protein [Bacteroidota bacterium]